MPNDTYLFMVWAHRNADSIFGASSNPVIRNGAFLCFEDEQKALAEADRLNGRACGSNVHYSVKLTPVRMELPSSPSNGKAAEPRYAMPLTNAGCTVTSKSF
jgi:hypothetical protein